jgi:PAS domain S-box-containing protein
MKVKQEKRDTENRPAVKSRVLLIEDHNTGQKGLKKLSRKESSKYEYVMAGSIAEARELVETSTFDVIITDFLLRDGTVFNIFESIRGIPIIVVTEGGDEGIAVKAMKAGAYDYIIKDPDMNYLKVLPMTIENAIKRKEFEEKLRLLESAVMSANDAIIILEAEPGEMMGRRILFVNEAFTIMTGYTLEEATKSTLRMLRGPGTSLEALNKIRIALESRRPVRVELINYRKDGSEFWVECNIVPFADEAGSFVHWVSVQRDITERKIAESEREKLIQEIEAMNADLTELNQELETIGTERTMSLMALTVADRIRNPASMIGGRCRRLLKKDNLPEDLIAGLQQIMEGAEKLDRIVSDFETLLKERQYKFKHHDLNSIVEKVVPVMEKEAALKGIRVTARISREPLRLNMQKDLLRVAIFHVMKNAVEATSQNGTIEVKTSKENDRVILTVSDTGYGIPDGEIDNVFKPFFSTKERGFGMGLPLVKQIVSEHLGDLIIESRAGQGSIFRMIFPTTWREGRL